MAMMGREIEISSLDQVVPNAAHNLGVITVSEFGNQDADRERAAIAERTRQQAWLVVEFFGGGFDAIAGSLGNVPAGNIGKVMGRIQDRANRALERELERMTLADVLRDLRKA